MPNGGLTPDCVHCQHFKGDYEVEKFQCNFHKMNLPIPIRIFCSDFLDPESVEDVDWLDEKLKRSKLLSDWMYVWLDWSDEEDWEAKGIKSTFEYFPLTLITEFKDWTREKFLEEMVKIADARRNQKR